MLLEIEEKSPARTAPDKIQVRNLSQFERARGEFLARV